MTAKQLKADITALEGQIANAKKTLVGATVWIKGLRGPAEYKVTGIADNGNFVITDSKGSEMKRGYASLADSAAELS